MADKITITSTLYIGLTDSENKLETMKLPNPKTNLTAEQVRAAANYLVDTIGAFDKYDNRFSTSSVTTAYIDNVRKTEIDVT